MDIPNLKEEKKAELQQFQTRYGFLFIGSLPNLYFWEILHFFRKLLLILTTDFMLSISEEVQSLCGILLLSVFAYLTQCLRPHPSIAWHNLDLHSSLVLLIRLYSGLYFLTAAGHDFEDITGFNVLVLLVVVLVQWSYMGAWVRQVGYEVREMALKRDDQRGWLVVQCLSIATCRKVNGKKVSQISASKQSPSDSQQNDEDVVASEGSV